MWPHGQMLGLKSHQVLSLPLLQGPGGCKDEPHTEAVPGGNDMPENLRVLAKPAATGPLVGGIESLPKAEWMPLPYLSDVQQVQASKWLGHPK